MRVAEQGRRRSPAASGFTLVEVLVATLVMVGLFVAVLFIFDANSRIARVQTQVADMQQSARIGLQHVTRTVRMAGRGGLPRGIPAGAVLGPVSALPAVAVRDNVGADGGSTDIAVGFASSPQVVAGTDVLVVRGVFNSPVYQLNSTDPTSFVLFDGAGAPTEDPLIAATGTLLLTNPGPAGIPQDLGPLAEAIADGVPEGLMLVSPIDDGIYGVVELSAATSAVDDPSAPTSVTLGFSILNGTHVTAYRTLFPSTTGNLPASLTSAAFVGILEEYRFYIREAREIAGDPASALRPRLSQARMFPATEVPYLGLLSEAQVDIADDILGLQVAMGFDSVLGEALTDRDGDGDVTLDDLTLTETTAGDADDWLFNGDADDDTDSPWSPPVGGWDDVTPQPELYYLRMALLARAVSPERNYQAPILARMENLDLGVGPFAEVNEYEERLHRRRLLTAVVDLRNL